MTLPALICHEPETGSVSIAGLTVLERLMVAAHRAGCPVIRVVSAAALPPLKRVGPLNIRYEVLASKPAITEPTLVLTTGALVQVADLERVMAAGGCLTRPDGDRLPVWIQSDDLAEVNALRAVAAEGVAERLTGPKDAPRVAAALWRSLVSSSDGLVDRYVNRPVGRQLFSKLLVHTPVTPNQVSLVSTSMGLVAAWWFGVGDSALAFWAAWLLQVSAVIDCVDGDLARVVFKESPLGKWLDIGGDQVVHVGIFLGIGVGLWRAGATAPVLWLSISAVIGVVISFCVVVRGLRQPERMRDTPLQKLIDATTNRDFSVLLIVLAWLGWLELFLWMTAIGVHLFWITALTLQWRQPAAVSSQNENGA